MKPDERIFLTAPNLHGGEGLPFSRIAASNEQQLASHFRFDAEDKALVRAVLGNGQVVPAPSGHDVA